MSRIIPENDVLRAAIEYATEEYNIDWLAVWNDGDEKAMDELGERNGWFHKGAGVYEEMTDEQ